MKRYRIVTVDYDNTLQFQRVCYELGPYYGEFVDWFVNHELVDMLRGMIQDGTKVYIVTARSPFHNADSEAQTPPERFVREQGLAVSGIYYTHGEFKAETLFALNSELHFDDSDEEMLAIQAVAPWIDRVLVDAPDA